MNFDDEIITLQFGNVANTIGAQFWNGQKYFYENFEDKWPIHCLHHTSNYSQNRAMESPLPRLICIDNAIPITTSTSTTSKNINFDITPKIETWKGNVKIYSLASENNKKEFNNENHHWSSMSLFNYHEKSFLLSSKNKIENPSIEMVMENIRYFAEGCDYLKGYHILIDELSEWNIMCSKTLIDIKDDYNKINLFNFNFGPRLIKSKSDNNQYLEKNMINRCYFLHYLKNTCDLIFPLLIGDNKLNNYQHNARILDYITSSYVTNPKMSHGSTTMKSYNDLFNSLNFQLIGTHYLINPSIETNQNIIYNFNKFKSSSSIFDTNLDDYKLVDSLIWKKPFKKINNEEIEILTNSNAKCLMEMSLKNEIINKIRCIRHLMISPFQISCYNDVDENDLSNKCFKLKNINMICRCSILEKHGIVFKNMAKDFRIIKNKLRSSLDHLTINWDVDYDDVNETINNLFNNYAIS